MATVLYMARRPLEELEEGILPDFREHGKYQDLSLLLLEEGVTSHYLPNVQTFAVRDDVLKYGVTTTVPLLTYEEVVKLLFEVDRVVVL